MLLYEAERHEPLMKKQWLEALASDHIRHIVTTTLAEFRGKNFWSVHPDLQQEYGFTRPIINLWQGAAGSMQGLNQLAAYQPDNKAFDFSNFLLTLTEQHEKSIAE